MSSSASRYGRRELLTSLGMGGVIAASAACAPSPTPEERSINLGFEELAAGPERWRELSARIAGIDLTGVAVAVGRVDWTGFPWTVHPDAASRAARGGRDLVAEALTEVRSAVGGAARVTLTIDAFAPRLLADHPDLAGVDVHGEPSEDFAGVAALESGMLGDRLQELAVELCRRYRPDRIAITELMFDHHTFGESDRESYLRWSGREDWPRDRSGEIDRSHESLGIWRSRVLATLLARIREAIAPSGTELEVDVRSPRTDPSADRPLSGHDYEMLLGGADRIAVWNFFGLDHHDPAWSGELAQSVEDRFPGRVTICTGLWAQDGSVPADALAASLTSIAHAGARSVAVTPSSLLGRPHWRVLANAWGSR